MTAEWIVLAAVFVSIIYGYKTNRNIAPLALSFSFFIGQGLLGLNAKELLSLLPIQILFNVLSITFFFGFAIENGTLSTVTSKILYAMRGYPRLMLPAVFLISFLISLSGAGIATAAFLSPLAFSLAYTIRANPLVAYAAVGAGTISGSNFMYSGGGIIVLNLVSDAVSSQLAFSVTAFSFIITAIICSSMFIVVYLTLKSGSPRESAYNKPDSFSPVQRKTLILIAVIVSTILVPNFVGEIFSSSVLRNLAKKLDVGFVMMIGGGISSLLNLADDRQVIRCQIPWTTLMTIGSVSLLIGVGQRAGLVETISGLISKHLPVVLIAPVLAFSAGLMSVFSSAIGVVIPTLYPLIPDLSSATGVDAGLLYSFVFIAATITGISPLSTTGSMILGGCKSEKIRSKLFYQTIFIPFILLFFVILFSLAASAILL